MSIANKIWFISAGIDKPKKRDHLLSRRQQYLNYGALCLATTLHLKGYSVNLVHGGHSDAIEFVEKLAKSGFFETKYPILISVPSFYALSWVQSFTAEVRGHSSKIKIVIGGRWVVGSDINWLKTKLPFADVIIPGLAEDEIETIVTCGDIHKWASVKGSSAPAFNLDHRLVAEFKKFQPSVEASRGCGMGCAFCEERDIPLTRLKDPSLLVAHLHEVATQYDDSSIRPYVQSSFFAPNIAWAEKMARAASLYGDSIAWRCESRVDSIKPEAIAFLAQAGLKVIDLGLESASPKQIVRMKKSSNPEGYLRAASRLIDACKQHDVWVKVNFLLYAGETEQTYLETIGWLDDHRDSIKGVSVGPVILFGSPRTTAALVSDIERLGGSIVDSRSSELRGISQVHLSEKISNQDAEDLSLEASRRYMTMHDYFDLKSFSYYARNYTYNDFVADVGNCHESMLPFSLESAH